jgi:bifunctional phosphoglucose/phosphomannose isomerase
MLPEDSPVRLLNGLRLSAGELDECDFFVFISYSGNSEEVVNAVRRLNPDGSRALCIASGGALAKEASSRGIPLIRLPRGYLPRFALPDLLGAVYGLLESTATLKLGYLSDACGKLESAMPGIEQAARELNTDPIISGFDRFLVGAFSGYEALARRWATQVCENAKVEAVAVVLPESFHNLIVPLCEGRRERSPGILILQDPGSPDAESEARRTEAFQQTLAAFGQVPCRVILPPRIKHRGARILAMCLLGDFFSVDLAERRRARIRETRSISHYKALLQGEGER